MSQNVVSLVGRITKEPELNQAGQSQVCKFTLAVNRNFKNQKGEYEADFINCTVFGNMAQTMEQYVSKGNLLAVTGRIQVRNYENNMGQRVYVTEIIVNNVSFLERKQESNHSSYDNLDDDLPF